LVKKKIDDFITISSILILIGIIILCAGIYFIKFNLTSSGITMGKTGRPYGTGTIDGKGMIFFGILFCLFGYVMRDKKK